MVICAALALGLAGSVPAAPPASRPAPEAPSSTYAQEIKPVLAKYCYECHGPTRKKADLDLSSYRDVPSILKDRNRWENVMRNLLAHEMPPTKKPQPSQAQRELVAGWIQAEIFKCDCTQPDPGRVTLRRLNRAEYNNTIRDLLGVDFKPAEDFPADDSGYGFDNIGDVLSLPPVLLERYLSAAEKILDQAVLSEDPNRIPVKRFDGQTLDGSAPGGPTDNGARALNREGDVYVLHHFPEKGDYLLRASAYGQQAGPEPPKMTFRFNDQELRTFEVPGVSTNPQVYEVRVTAQPGTNRFAAAYINNYVNQNHPDRRLRGDRNLMVEYLEIVGPLDRPPVPLPETHRRVFVCTPSAETRLDCARDILQRFVRRAFRRPVHPDEVERLLRFVTIAEKNGDNFEMGIRLALQAVLVSPHFLFRGELQPEPNNSNSVHAVNEHALASRLSYFLWSSMPDDELFALADRGALQQNLEAQVRRMLRDAKAKALVENFAGQWLQLRNMELATPDPKTFPDFDEALRAAMRRETEMLFEHILRQDRSVLEFLSADYTFVNERLARHYGLKAIKGETFRRVSLQGTPRSGVLTHGSILTLTSNPTRTSPVKRGKWVLENIMGTPPPPPPPEVPELSEDKQAVLSGPLRQRMEQHRDNPNCASCHARMDPIGFGFENFDGVGAWREKDAAFPIDPSGQLVTGERFNGPAQLKTILLKNKRDGFIRCLSEKMLTYALGRGLEYYDKCAIDQISKGVARGRNRFSALVLEMVKSPPFQLRRGEGEREATAAR